MKKKNIFFVLDDFSGGGAARVISLVGSELQNRGYSVNFVIDTNKPINYEIHPNIKIISLYGNKSCKGIFKTILCTSVRLRKLIKANNGIWIAALPSIVFCFWIASLNLNVKKIASDHTSFERKLSKFANFIRHTIYSKFDAVTILTKADYDYLNQKLPKKTVLPNPINGEYFYNYENREKIVLAVGRLDVWYEKGFDILLEAWNKVSRIHPDWILHIAGTGKKTSFQYLESVIQNLQLGNSVKLIGQHKDIKSIMRKSSIFTLTSRVEGFGLVLIEAMSQGCACISFDCGGRQKEIIQTSEQGIIIDTFDADELAYQLSRLIKDFPFRKNVAKSGCLRSKSFDIKIIADKWEELLKKI